MFPKRISIKEYSSHWDYWFWRQLCVVYDNEALGILERLLVGFDIKVDETFSVSAKQEDGTITTL